MVNISLTVSMRSNLLSLQSIASQQNLVQNRLATGLKVSSAIDNPSSYYTAQSLNNRAGDLTALLDTMSQGIQTLKAVSETITSATQFLEQAKAVANQAMETTQPIVAIVSNEADLQAALASDKRGLIVIDRDITMSTNSNIVLKDGQSLVGAKYLDKTARQTSISFNFVGEAKNGIEVGNSSIVSDLDLNLVTDKRKEGLATIYSKGINSTLKNLNISIDTTGAAVVAGSFGITNVNSVNLEGYINIKASGDYTRGISNASGGNIYYTINVKNALINIDGDYGIDGIFNLSNSNMNIKAHNAMLYGELNILDNKSTVHASGLGNIFLNYKISSVSGAKLYINSKSYESQTAFSTTNINNGAIPPLQFVELAGVTPPAFPNIDDEIAKDHRAEYKKDIVKESNQYNSILKQFDMMIKDSSYKGVNLLLDQSLKVNFNEDRSSKLDIHGVNASTNGLGLNDAAWKNQNNVDVSIAELDSAISDLRQYASEFGNYYSIVSNREEFTNNLVNVLTEGADKLKLADMNQESANMLALQTSQSLAINSLSLASQASQSILKLF